MRKSVLLVLALWLGAAPAAGQERASDKRVSRAAVEARLRTHELPPAPEAWRALGAGADEVLAEVGRDAKAEVLLRARALSALGHFPTPVARRCLEDTIARHSASTVAGDRLLLRKAAVALGWMGGRDVPARLGPLLENPDPDVRLDAALGLGLTRLSAAAELLRRRHTAEPVARVRTQIGRQLRVIEDALAVPRDRAPPPAR